MKATLEFTLPDEQGAHSDAIHGSDWRCVVQDMDNWLRNGIKYGDFGSETKQLIEAREHLHACISDYGLDLWRE